MKNKKVVVFQAHFPAKEQRFDVIFLVTHRLAKDERFVTIGRPWSSNMPTFIQISVHDITLTVKDRLKEIFFWWIAAENVPFQICNTEGMLLKCVPLLWRKKV
jgi:hypothetical protein